MTDAIKKVEQAANSFMRSFKALKQPTAPDKSHKATKKREKELVASVDRRHLRKSGRTELWGIRCRPDLKEECKKIARELGMFDSEWAEQVFEAAIAAHRGAKK